MLFVPRGLWRAGVTHHFSFSNGYSLFKFFVLVSVWFLKKNNKGLLSLIVSASQEFGSGLAWWFWLRVSHEVEVKISLSCSHLKPWLGPEDLLYQPYDLLSHLVSRLASVVSGGLSSYLCGPFCKATYLSILAACHLAAVCQQCKEKESWEEAARFMTYPWKSENMASAIFCLLEESH